MPRSLPRRRLALGAALALCLLACGPGSGEVGAPPGGHGGMYEVRGLTTPLDGTPSREIRGTLILAGTGPEYTATFSLETAFSTPEGPIEAELIGQGQGRARGTTLVGTAETQMRLAAIPGIDPKFPWIPGHLGPRIQSDFRMTAATGGGFDLAIETRAAPGERYTATRTTLHAVRTPSPLERVETTAAAR